MFKYISSAAVLFSFALSSPALASQVNCRSNEKIEGWVARYTHDYAVISADASTSEKLHGVHLTGAYLASAETIIGKSSQNGKWTRFNGLADAWCNYSIAFPTSNFNNDAAIDFTGYLNRTCEGDIRSSFRLSCSKVN